MLNITEETDDLITVSIRGKITEEEVKSFQSSLQQKSRKGRTYNALLNVDSFDGIEFSAIDDVVSGDKGNFKRVAVVGDGNLEKFGSKVVKPFFRADVKHFGSAESASARQWVGAPKVQSASRAR